MPILEVQQRVVAVEATDELADLFGNGDKSGHLATPTSGFSRGVPQPDPRNQTSAGRASIRVGNGEPTSSPECRTSDCVGATCVGGNRAKVCSSRRIWWRARLPGLLPSGVVPRSICTAYVVEMTMVQERQVRLFRNGRNQALRIPRDLELPGRAATLRKEGSRLIVEPVAGPSLLAVLATLKPLAEELPRIARPVAEPVEM